MTPSSRAGYINAGWSASGTYESANFKIIELKVFQIKEIYPPAKLFRIGGVQRPSNRTGASLIVSSCIQYIGSAKKKVSLTVQELESCTMFAQNCFTRQWNSFVAVGS